MRTRGAAGDAVPRAAESPEKSQLGRDNERIIEIRSVCKDFLSPTGAVQSVLRNVECEIFARQLVCILGPTGCGKSTLLNLIAGFDQPTAGRILFHGNDVLAPAHSRVVVFQDAGSALFGWRSVRQNAEYPLKLRGRITAEERDARVRQLLDLVHLGADAEKFPYQLSGGGKQRLQIARALAADPEVLLMDEPLGALDALTKLGLQREIVGLVTRTQKTIVYITHDIVESALISDRVLLMSPGPAATIVRDIANPLPHPRSVGDPAVATLIRHLEDCVLGAGAARSSELPTGKCATPESGA